MADKRERRNYAGSIEQTTAVRSPQRTPRPSRIRGVVRKPWRPAAQPVTVQRDGKAVAKEHVANLQKAGKAIAAILDTANPEDLLDDIAIVDGTDARKAK